jgi:cystathionine beta-lyase/cystathionine gamma-synthase
MVFSSGMATIDAVIQALVRSKEHIICTQTLYGCTDDLFSKKLPQFGIEFSFVDTRNLQNVKKAFKKNTKIVFLETPANPTLDLADIKAISEIAHKKNVLVIVDNSFASPFNQRPLEIGADFVIQSVTKYLSGHGDLIMGAVAGNKKLINAIADWRSIRGAIPSPQDCFLAARGLKTFALRMEKHNSNALKLAGFLESHPAVARVFYPGIESHPQHGLAKTQMLTEKGEPGFGGMIVFELGGSIKSTERFLEYLAKKTFVALAVSLGYTETLIQHPASMTHALLLRKERLKKGITDNMLRISVGIEDYEDIENAFKKALDSA